MPTLTRNQLRGLEHRFHLPTSHNEPIFELLELRPDLLDLLLEASDQLQSYFPGEPQQLTRLDAPDLDQACLGLVVHTDQPLAEVQRRLDAFDENWWLENFVRGAGQLLVLTLSLETH